MGKSKRERERERERGGERKNVNRAQAAHINFHSLVDISLKMMGLHVEKHFSQS